MVTLLKSHDKQCDARCYTADGGECDCVCGGENYGVGLFKALENAQNKFALQTTFVDINDGEIVGLVKNRKVFLDGVEVTPNESLRYRDHSTEGFMWGYAGAGPAQLSLAILLCFIPAPVALSLYEQFKYDIVRKFNVDQDFRLPISVIRTWLNLNGYANA